MTPVPRPIRSLLAAAIALSAAPVCAQTYSETIFFGDSLTDSGFYRPLLVQQAGPQAAVLGRFTTNPGQVWAEFLADFYGTGANAAWGLTATGIVDQDGTNYAAGGARVGLTPGFPPSPPTQFAPSLEMQVGAYLAANGGRADPNALFTVWGGANDLFFHLNGATTQAQFLASAGRLVGLVGTLQGAGARYILVPTMPDVGKTPFGLSQGAAASAGISMLVGGYNQALFGGLAQAGYRVIPVDVFSLVREITADPARYGFSNVVSPACGATSSLVCSPGDYVAPDAASTHAFADGVHPTTAAHAIIADLAIAMLEGPRQVAQLPHSAAVLGRSRAERVAAHAAHVGGGEGMRWWADVRGDSQRYGDGDDFDGIGPTLTFGVDWRSGNLVYGGFAGYGRQDIDWGLRRGDFQQTDATVGAFLGWQGDGPWANGQLSYTRLGFDVARDVQLGPATRTHRGSPDGSNLSAGISAGWNLHHGALTHGPVLSLLSQRIQVDGYDEDSAQSSALAYPEQDFDSLIGSLGWQASYAITDRLRPYARLTADREFGDQAEEAFARSLSLPGSLQYGVPGAAFDEEYGTLVIGARTRLFGLEADLGARTTVGHHGGNDAGVFLTLGAGF